MKLTAKEFAKLFDHTLLRADALPSDFEKLCSEAVDYGFKSVAVNAASIKMCRAFLAGSDVLSGAAVSFPLGQCTLDTKLFETSDAIDDGAQEIDYVCNVAKLKGGDVGYIEREMRGIVELCRGAGVTVKVIYENCYLTSDEIRVMSEIAASVGPDFVKTSTGFGKGGATIADVTLMKSIVGDKIGVKAAGGVRTLEFAEALIGAGVTRIGSSSGVAIMNEFFNKTKEG